MDISEIKVIHKYHILKNINILKENKNLKAAIIGASEESLHTIQKAKEQNLEIVALDGNPRAEGLKMADRGIVCDISDEEKTIQVLRQEQIDFVLTVPIGRYLTTTGSVNDALHLKGISSENASVCTDKWKFHETLQKKNLRPCHAYLIKDEQGNRSQSVRDIIDGKCPLSFPAILKPRYGSGSRGIFFIQNDKELKNRIAETGGESYILEEWINGPEYGVDGAVINGVFTLILLRKKENTPLPNRQAVAYFSVNPEIPFFQEVKTFMEQVVKELSLSDCLLHADLIQAENGPFIIEMSARPSGHNLHNLFTPLCTGIDMAEEYIKYCMGKPYSFHPSETKPMMIHYFDMCGTVHFIPDRKLVEKTVKCPVAAWNCHIQKGDVLPAVTNGHSLMKRGFFILEGKDMKFLKQETERIKQLFQCRQ